MGSFVSYLYYKKSVEGPTSVVPSEVVSSPLAASETEPEKVLIRHRPTTYEPELEINPD